MRKTLILFLSLFIISPVSLISQELNQTDDMGRKQGKWRKTYLSGVVKYEGQFRNDRPYGEFKYYYPDAKLQAVSKFSNDGIIARTITYHENGLPMAEGKYINQQRDSTWNMYSDVDGSLVMKENYKKGKLDGESILYYPGKEQVAEITHYKEGLKEGPYIKYFPDGKIMTKGNYKNDKLDGDFSVYYDNGNTEIKGKYKNGIQVGNWQYFDEEGNALSEEAYKKQKNYQPEEK